MNETQMSPEAMAKFAEMAGNPELKAKLTALEASGDLKFVPNPHYQASSKEKLQPVPFDWDRLLTLCVQAMQAGHETVMLPVAERRDTKKNKARLVQSDSTSPLGMIEKDNKGIFNIALTFPAYPDAQFKIVEVVQWMVRTGKVSDE